MTFQELVIALERFWADRECLEMGTLVLKQLKGHEIILM